MMCNMDEEPRTRLARMIRARRLELRLSERQAALRAGVARNTWASAEEGTRQPAERSSAGIEEALGWEHGSIDVIMAGGKPRFVIDLQDHKPPSPDSDVQREIERISKLDLPATARMDLIRRVLDLYEEAAAEKQERQQAPS